MAKKKKKYNFQFDRSEKKSAKEKSKPNQTTNKSAEIEVLFNEGIEDFRNNPPESILIEASSFAKIDNQDRIKLLFDLAIKSFSDQEIEKRLNTKLVTSVERTVVSEEANKRLIEAEKALHKPAFSLKSGYSDKRKREEETERTTPLNPANLKIRAAVLLIDLIFFLFLAISFTAIWTYFENSQLFFYFFNSISPLWTISFLYLKGNFIIASLITFLIYPWLNLKIWGNTIGLKRMNAQLLRQDRLKNANSSKLIIRYLILPISLVLNVFGLVPLLFKGKNFADYLSNTVPCQKIPE